MRVLATLEALRDQVRDEILKDPRYLTYQALERSIHDIRAALAGSAAAAPPDPILLGGPAALNEAADDVRANGDASGPAYVNGAPRSLSAPEVDSEAMANLQHALIDLINSEQRGKGCIPGDDRAQALDPGGPDSPTTKARGS
jgi:hypothetical protein